MNRRMCAYALCGCIVAARRFYVSPIRVAYRAFFLLLNFPRFTFKYCNNYNVLKINGKFCAGSPSQLKDQYIAPAIYFCSL